MFKVRKVVCAPSLAHVEFPMFYAVKWCFLVKVFILPEMSALLEMD